MYAYFGSFGLGAAGLAAATEESIGLSTGAIGYIGAGLGGANLAGDIAGPVLDCRERL